MRKRRGKKPEPRQMTLPGVEVAKKGPPERPGPITRARLMLTSKPLTRRRFLAGTLGWVSAGIAAALGIPAEAAVVSPALREADVGWSPVARIGKPEPGEPDLSVVGVPVLTSFTSLVEDAYMKATPKDVAIYAVNLGNDEFVVYDARCTHLGCPFNWSDKDQEFLCPCHNGVFDKDGRVIGGPAPRPLDHYEYKVENGVLYVGKLFRVNDELQRITT
jgi:menaquinol-cytochrome c reductase iron-sulfur subunit